MGRSPGGTEATRSFDAFVPLSRVEALGWRIRIEGSLGRPEREWNGPVRGWQEIYREGIANLGDDFLALDDATQDARIDENAS